MKTPLQQYIEELEMVLKTEQCEMAKKAITNCLFRANAYLVTENKIIEEAFNQGFREGEQETMVANKKDVSECGDAKNYFNRTFK